MTLSLQQVSDRIEINDLLIRYTRAIDQKDWELLDTVFTPDAEVDYVATGGIKGRYPEVRGWLEKVLGLFPITVHYVTNSEVTLQGDRAAARTAVYNPMFLGNADGSLNHFTVGAYYVDELVRTAAGWRIAKRREEKAFMQGSPPNG